MGQTQLNSCYPVSPKFKYDANQHTSNQLLKSSATFSVTVTSFHDQFVIKLLKFICTKCPFSENYKRAPSMEIAFPCDYHCSTDVTMTWICNSKTNQKNKKTKYKTLQKYFTTKSSTAFYRVLFHQALCLKRWHIAYSKTTHQTERKHACLYLQFRQDLQVHVVSRCIKFLGLSTDRLAKQQEKESEGS